MALEKYRSKRNFNITKEPRGEKGEKREELRFVIQQHHASRMHYDFRLEMDGVLKSWAVPKGPCLDPDQKRLAVQVEDHPVGYIDFEGSIPKGQYGAGNVIVWDIGVWEAEGDPEYGLKKGHLSFSLKGKKLKGAWNLVRMNKPEKSGPVNWLLIKQDDKYARSLKDDILVKKPKSVLSQRTIAQMDEKRAK